MDAIRAFESLEICKKILYKTGTVMAAEEEGFFRIFVYLWLPLFECSF